MALKNDSFCDPPEVQRLVLGREFLLILSRKLHRARMIEGLRSKTTRCRWKLFVYGGINDTGGQVGPVGTRMV